MSDNESVHLCVVVVICVAVTAVTVVVSCTARRHSERDDQLHHQLAFVAAMQIVERPNAHQVHTQSQH